MNARPDRIPLSLHPAEPLRAGAQAVIRAAICCLLAKEEKKSVADIAQERYPSQRDALKFLQRGATTPTTSASAAVLAQLGTGFADFLSLMGPASASSALLNSGLQLSFDGVAGLPVPGLKADASNVSWLTEGGAISVRQIDVSGVNVLLPYKLPVICVFTREMLQRSLPNIEAVVRAVLTESVGAALDQFLFDATVGDGTRPSGLRYNVTALTPSADTNRFEAAEEDIGNLVAAVAPVAANGLICLVCAPAQACALRMWTQNKAAEYYPILSSNGLANRTVMAIASRALVSAADPAPRFSLASEATIHMDTSALDITTGAVATSVKSLWQTDSVGLKMILEISWGMRAPGSVAWMSSVLW